MKTTFNKLSQQDLRSGRCCRALTSKGNMRFLIGSFLLIYSYFLSASPQFGVCAFVGELLEKPQMKDGKYQISVLPKEIISISEEELWQNQPSLCPKLNEKYTSVVYFPPEDAKGLVNYSVGGTVHLVREYMDGLYINGEVINTEEFKLWKNTQHKVNKSIKKDAASGLNPHHFNGHPIKSVEEA